ncbi:YaaA family protein [Oerskovia sp. KBS0722]|uniref:YaaA family protein n=1 Tax=Oerskovia sp. KBS0722 TaxID=1179673 RepID=UPI00110F3D83|nr:peroxide stress protein YaaA [Oerskovia sp. KBS0722]QDW63694.1 peroxide stress protein YaaA [Oerskovia sp. KBS0722]
MLLLLPPSEGKSAPDDGAPLDLMSLSSPSLTRHRKAVLKALVAASRRRDALDVLGVSGGLADEVARNVSLATAPTAPAAEIYSGVLYAAAGLADLPPAAAARAEDSVRIVSALWGAVSPADRIPAYRLSMGTQLPPLGALAPSWRPHLAAALDVRATGDVVIDCRSAPYAAAWKVPAEAEHVAVRVLRELDGKRSVVSHNAKHTRGVLTGHLLTRAEPVHTAEELLKAAYELVGTALLDATLLPGARGASTLELVVS